MNTNVAAAPAIILQFLNNAGQPNVGGTLLTQVGGVNYPTFQDPAGATPLPNPIPLNSRGEISNSSGISSQLFLGTGVTYDMTLSDANGNTIWVASNVTAQSAGTIGTMIDEKGSNGLPGFSAANGDFTPGTTTSLTLSSFYGSASNLWVAFDGAEQGADTYQLSNYTLTFGAYVGGVFTPTPIPVGTSKVFVKGGSTFTIGTPGAGTVTDASVAPNAGIQSSKLAFMLGDSGAVSRTVYSKLAETISAKDFGAVGDGVTDDTTALQNFINAITITGQRGYIPAGRYCTTKRLTINGSCEIFGDGWQDIRDYDSGGVNTNWGADAFPRGTIIYQNYPASTDIYGFYVTGNSVIIRDLEIEQNQGNPDSGSWSPTVGPTAIYAYTAPYYAQGASSLFCYNIMLRNTYAGITLHGCARGILEKIFGQPITTGISVTQNGDVLRIRDIHLGWTFWSASAQVLAQQLANGVGIQLGRVDNPNLESIFTYGLHIGIKFYVDTTPTFGGQTSQCEGTNWGFDNGVYGIYAQDSVDLKVTNCYIYCQSGTTPGSINIYSVNTLGAGYTVKMMFKNLDLNGADLNSCFFANAGQVQIDGCNLRAWNASSGGYAGIRTSAANVTVDGLNVIGSNANGGQVFEIDSTGTFSGYFDLNQNVQYGLLVVTGTCDGSGNAIFSPPPAMSTPTFQLLNIQGFYAQSSTLTAFPMTFNFLSASAVSLSGGGSAANQPYRVTIMYSPLAVAGW